MFRITIKEYSRVKVGERHYEHVMPYENHNQDIFEDHERLVLSQEAPDLDVNAVIKVVNKIRD